MTQESFQHAMHHDTQLTQSTHTHTLSEPSPEGQSEQVESLQSRIALSIRPFPEINDFR